MRWAMMIVAALVPAVGATEDRPLLTIAGLRAASPAALGDLLLASGHPPIVRADVLPEAKQVALYARTVRFDHGFCRAPLFRVMLAPLDYATDASADGPPLRASGVTTAAVYRVSAAPEACEPDTRGYFPVSGGADADGRALVRALIAVKAAAASGARVPPATCADHSGGDGGGCSGSTRALLAALRTDAIGNVSLKVCADRKTGAPKPCASEIWLGASGGEAAYWVVTATMRGAEIARLALSRESVAGR